MQAPPQFDVHLTDSLLDSSLLPADEVVREWFRRKIVVVCGLPGAGKGTHCARIQQRYGVIHLSTGDLFREEVSRGTEVGKIIGPIMASGQFVPPEYANKILAARLSSPDITEHGVMLDGFPRSLEHLNDLDVICKQLGKTIDRGLFLDVSEEDSIARISGRRLCTECKAISNVAFLNLSEADKCVECGKSALIKRADDAENVVKKRFAVAREHLGDLLQELYRRDILLSLHGSASLDRTTEKIVEVLMCPERFTRKLTPCGKLAALFKSRTFNEAELRALVLEFRDASLTENASKRTGVMRRWVYLATTNALKLAEFTHLFDRYGIEVLQVPALLSDYDTLISALLSTKSSDLVPMAVLSEQSSLLKPGTTTPSTERPGVLAEHFSVLSAWTANNAGKVTLKQYTHATLGRLIQARGGEYWGTGPVFGWDDRFVLLATGKTYQEHRQVGLKISSRDMVISGFLADKVYYKQLKNLAYAPVGLSRPVDFTVDVADFVAAEPHYNSPLSIEMGLRSMLNHVLNEGVFFKGADTRIEMNYWQPGLNAGIPLISKKDPIHERTFMFHDFGHFLMKDLIFTGQDSPLHRSVYIISRMISEAVTIMLADGVFVSTMQRQGVAYDFSTRRIYPLFMDTGLNFENKENFVSNLRLLTKASVDYTVKGDDSTFKNLLIANGKTEESLAAYKEKFKPFFVSDLQWTAHNYDNMASRAIEMRKWWELTANVRAKLDEGGGPLESIDEFLSTMSQCDNASEIDSDSLSDLVDRVFAVIFETRVAPVFQQQIELQPKEKRITRGFTRYIIGQMGIFARFDSVAENENYLKKIEGLVLSDAPILEVRKAYEEYVSLLAKKNLITMDDAHNFVEIYPLFEPFYVTYDKQEVYPELAPLAHSIIGVNAHRSFQISLAEKYIHRSLTNLEKRYLNTMSLLIEGGGGQVDKGLFVTRPGVALLAYAGEEKMNSFGINIKNEKSVLHASFLISGVSLETSMELCAHKEASVARLTSSKTQAMNVPFFRVQGTSESLGGSIAYLRLALNVRASFERREDPRVKWGKEGVELFNLSQAGSKCTALVYTMTISDFHKLFVGRMGEAGNELEVREVVRIMASQLHVLYPTHICEPSVYLSLDNGAKYAPSPSATLGSEKVSGAGIIADTVLTPIARRIFNSLHIDSKQTDAHQLGEFCSRITYLAFPTTAPTHDSSVAYMHKLIIDKQHLSVVAACRISIALGDISSSQAVSLQALCAPLGVECVYSEVLSVAVVTASLKTFHVLFGKVMQTPSREIGIIMHQVLKLRHPFVIRDSYEADSKKRKMDFEVTA